jgi:hypothetical protein
VIWLPAALLVFPLARLRYRHLGVKRLAVAGFVLEVVTTLGSALFRAKQPPYGIFFGSFLWYLSARLLFWVPLAYVVLGLLRRPSPTSGPPETR